MEFCISPEQLRKALAEIEAAEANGFKHCRAVFKLATVGAMLYDTTADFNDLWVRAHPTDGSRDWGRAHITRTHQFKAGKLMPFEWAKR